MIKDLIEHNYMPESPNKKSYTSLRKAREITVTEPNEPRVPTKKQRPRSSSQGQIK